MTEVDFSKQEHMVFKILTRSLEARNDDYVLMAEVITEYYPQVAGIPFQEALREHERYGVPSFESFTRVRRKIQARIPALAGDRKRKQRAEMEQQFREYAREGLFR